MTTTDELVGTIPTLVVLGAIGTIGKKIIKEGHLPKGDKTNLKLNLKVEVGNK